MSLPVPVEFLRDMTLHLADLERGLAARSPLGSPADSLADGDVDPETGSQSTVRRKAGIVWTAEQWEGLHRKANISSARVLSIVAKLPVGEADARPLSALAADAGMSDDELRAALSWLTRHVRATPDLYPVASWPFGWKVGQQVDSENPHVYHYWFSEEQSVAYREGLDRWLDAEN